MYRPLQYQACNMAVECGDGRNVEFDESRYEVDVTFDELGMIRCIIDEELQRYQDYLVFKVSDMILILDLAKASLTQNDEGTVGDDDK